MLEDINLKEEKSQECKEQIKYQGEKLAVLSQKIRAEKVPVIVVFEGWGAAGKGSLIGKLILNLDPRAFDVFTTNEPTEEEKRKPYMNRFWMNIPARGYMSIFNKSWYHDYSKDKTEIINTFERQLADDDYLIVKYFIHISKKEQKKRMEKLLENKNTRWRVNDKDLKQNRNYDKNLQRFNDMIAATDTEYAPWHLISGMDKDEALLEILKVLNAAIEGRLNARKPVHKGILPSKMEFPLVKMPKLSEVDLSPSLTEEEYRVQLDAAQKKLSKLAYKLYRKDIPLIICYEGWDAAGKGGNIKRVAASLDPRDYDVKPVCAPDLYEAGRHYLWRFQKYVPKSGHTQIFDRTWYGRVMVERLEGFCTSAEYRRAYNEINEFEKELTDWGAIVVKFWLHIDKDEQLRRFKDRQNTPEKRWKITDEDWRNREKWDLYEKAVDDMIKYTSTEYAPWHIIESNSKYYARVKAINVLIEEIEKRLSLL